MAFMLRSFEVLRHNHVKLLVNSFVALLQRPLSRYHNNNNNNKKSNLAFQFLVILKVSSSIFVCTFGLSVWDLVFLAKGCFLFCVLVFVQNLCYLSHFTPFFHQYQATFGIMYQLKLQKIPSSRSVFCFVATKAAAIIQYHCHDLKLLVLFFCRLVL